MENRNIPYNKYHNGTIYNITDIAYAECYIGSTVQPVCNRMSEHRKDYKRFKNGGKGMEYRSFVLFDKHGVENCKIELIESYPCESREELTKREGYWIQLNEGCVNKQIAGRNKKQYYQDTVDVWREYHKHYRETNKDKIRSQHQEHYDNNKEEILSALKEYYLVNKDKILARSKCYAEKNSEKLREYHLEYRLLNHEKIKEYNAQYRKENKDKLNAKTTCAVCGSFFISCHKARHEKTQKHLAALEKNK